MNINFRLRPTTSRKSKKRTVQLRVYLKGKKKDYSTEIRVDINDWDQSSQRVKKKLGYALYVNKKLDDFYEKVKSLDIPLTSWDDIDKIFQKTEQVKQPTFFDLFDEYIKDSQSRVSLRGATLASSTLVVIKGCKTTLEEFVEKTGYQLQLKTSDNNFYSKFRTYCLVDRETPYGVNTFGGKIKKLKAFLAWVKKTKKLQVNEDFEDFKAPSFYSEEIPSLLPDELVELWDKNLGKDQYKLDIFLFLCSTGMRYSDFKRIGLDINKFLKDSANGKAIVFKATKTNCTCIVPFYDDLYFRPVFLNNKYSGKLPTLSEQKLNDFLQESGLFTRFSPSTKIGRKTMASIKYFHQHIPAQSIMPIGGWKTESEFRRYAGTDISQVVKANRDKATFLKVN